MHVRIKICGITTLDALDAAVSCGADAVGFVFSESPRCVTIDKAAMLMEQVPPFVTKVAVFRYPNANEVAQVATELRPDFVQTEPTPEAWSAIIESGTHILPVFHDEPNLSAQFSTFIQAHEGLLAALLEGPGRGGRGIAPNWTRAARLSGLTRLVLAGGLSPDNVASAILQVRPYAVDVSSGVESSVGVKDVDRIRDFVLQVRSAENSLRPVFEALA